jgi:hypothetical protein
VWVDTLEQRTEFTDPQWLALPAPPIPRPARGEPLREVTVTGDRVVVANEHVYEIPWHELAGRLEETQIDRVLASSLTTDGLDGLWKWPSYPPPEGS